MILHFQTLSHTREKRLLNSSCLSVRLSVCMYVYLSTRISSSSTGRIFAEFDTENFHKICRKKNSDLFKIGQKYQTLYTKT